MKLAQFTIGKQLLSLLQSGFKSFLKRRATNGNKATRQSLLFHPDAFGLACVDLPKPASATYCVRVRSPKLNIPIRLIQFYNGSTDQELYRLDVLFGWATLRDQFACRVVG